MTNTNMAQTYTNFSQQQVLNQVGIAMLSQAQQQPDAILKLLS
ncbi:MAG: flagellin [Firmicutes bacterium]|nr:flagellin [Bacillota bacterium]